MPLIFSNSKINLQKSFAGEYIKHLLFSAYFAFEYLFSFTGCNISAGWNLTGRDWGCCGNYEGCCKLASKLCYLHDRVCHCCTLGWFLCGPECTPDSDCLANAPVNVKHKDWLIFGVLLCIGCISVLYNLIIDCISLLYLSAETFIICFFASSHLK